MTETMKFFFVLLKMLLKNYEKEAFWTDRRKGRNKKRSRRNYFVSNEPDIFISSKHVHNIVTKFQRFLINNTNLIQLNRFL